MTPYFEEIDLTNSTFGVDDASGGVVQNDVFVIDLGDTKVSQQQFQQAIFEGDEDAYVIKMTQTKGDFKKAFDITQATSLDLSGTAQFHEVLAKRYDPSATNTNIIKKATQLEVVTQRDGGVVTGGLKRPIADCLSMQESEIGDDELNKRFSDWIIPTLFDGHLYDLPKKTSVLNDPATVDVSDVKNKDNKYTTKVSKHDHILKALNAMGKIEIDSTDPTIITWQDNGVKDQRNKRLIFKARLISAHDNNAQIFNPATNTYNTVNKANVVNIAFDFTEGNNNV